MEQPTPEPPLRERKRLASMLRIQTVALELFEAEGFDNVTVERIAAESEVSPSSVYRWFGTKEHIVIWDEYDPAALAAIEEELATAAPIDALRTVVAGTMGAAFADDAERIKRRLRIAFSNPSVEAASALQAYGMAAMIADVLSGSLDEADALDVQIVAHAFVGALLGTLRHWHDAGFTTPIEEIIERPLAVVEKGAPLT
jgi:AcrR family transcriptional regulator